MKIYRLSLVVACLASMVAVFSSCDNEYDLSKDIDSNINVGKNFILPVGETVKIPLSRIIKEGNDLTVNSSGVYELKVNDSINSSIQRVEPFEISGLQPQFSNFSYSGLPQYNLDQEVALDDLNIETSATYTISETKTELPSEIEALYLAEFNNEEGVNSKIQISIESKDNGISEMTLNNVSVKFPEIITLKNGQHEVTIEKIVLNKENDYSQDITINIANIAIPSDNTIQKKYITEENGKRYFSLDESISFNTGSTKVVINPSKVQNTELNIQFGYSIENTKITRVNGILAPNVSINTSLGINDLPDFIKDKSSTFTPEEMNFSLSINNPVDMPIETTVSITAWDNDKNATIGDPIYIELKGDNAIKPSNKTYYLITNKECLNKVDTITYIVNEDLVKLLATIPDSYKITTDAIKANGTNAGNGFKLGEDNLTLQVNYDVQIPFSFKNLEINYTDFVDELKEDLEDVADLTNKIILNVDAESTIPTELVASVKLYDSFGKELKQIKVTGTSENTLTIKAHDPKNGNATVTPITLTIEELEGSTQLEDLEKLEYTIKAKNSKENIQLKSDQYLILKNGVAKIPNGITTEL